MTYDVESIRRKAEAGNSDMQFQMGYMYQCGLGVPQSYEKAAEWYMKIKKPKNATLFNLAILYMKGQGVEQSDTQAFRLF